MTKASDGGATTTIRACMAWHGAHYRFAVQFVMLVASAPMGT